MGWFSRGKQQSEARASVNDPQFWTTFFNRFFKSKSGILVSADTAMRSTVVFACVKVLSETVGSLPLMVYKKRKNGGKDIAVNHPLYSLLHDAPNDIMTSCEWREMKTGHTALRGNSYSFVQRDGGGRVKKIFPLNPVRVTPVLEDTDKLIYQYMPDKTGKPDNFDPSEILHIKGLTYDGILGISPVSYAREAIGLALAAEEYGARFLQNDARSSLILEYPGTLKKEKKDEFRDQLQERQTGEERFKALILDGGIKVSDVGLSNQDAQFLETRNYQVEDIARIFRVPTVLIGHPDKTSTYASAEQFFLSFVVHTIRPWLVRWEQAMNRVLLTDAERRAGYFIEFKVDGLLRGDIKTRYVAYQIGRQNGWLSRNDIRDLENMNPIKDGDDYLTSKNYDILGKEEKAPDGETVPPGNGDNSEPQKEGEGGDDQE